MHTGTHKNPKPKKKHPSSFHGLAGMLSLLPPTIRFEEEDILSFVMANSEEYSFLEPIGRFYRAHGGVRWRAHLSRSIGALEERGLLSAEDGRFFRVRPRVGKAMLKELPPDRAAYAELAHRFTEHFASKRRTRRKAA
jgi:hypothetical protein